MSILFNKFLAKRKLMMPRYRDGKRISPIRSIPLFKFGVKGIKTASRKGRYNTSRKWRTRIATKRTHPIGRASRG